jgi:hypothetical protein
MTTNPAKEQAERDNPSLKSDGSHLAPKTIQDRRPKGEKSV